MGHTVVELLVSLALGALAVVVILGSGAEQLVLEVGVFLFLRLQLGLQGRGLVVVMLALVLALVLFLGLGGLFLGASCAGVSGFSAAASVSGAVCFFSSWLIAGLSFFVYWPCPAMLCPILAAK